MEHDPNALGGTERQGTPDGVAARTEAARKEADVAALDDWVQAWADAVELEQRRALERRIFDALRGNLTECAGATLRRVDGRAGGTSVEAAMNQAFVELPTILAAWNDRPRGGGPSGFHRYALASVRNLVFALAERSRRDRAFLERLASSRPSRLGRAPTTPSQAEMRVEFDAFLDAELARLDGLDQEIVRRYRAGETTFAGIGRALGVPPRTVQDRFERCAAKLRRSVERALGGDPFEH